MLQFMLSAFPCRLEPIAKLTSLLGCLVGIAYLWCPEQTLLGTHTYSYLEPTHRQRIIGKLGKGKTIMYHKGVRAVV